MSLQSFLHGIARAFTIPHHEREQINAQLLANPGALAAINQAKESLIIGLIHASVGSHMDPVEAALSAAALAQQVERAIPTPSLPDPAAVPDTTPATPFRPTALPVQSPPAPTVNPPTVRGLDLPAATAPPALPPVRDVASPIAGPMP